MFVSYWIDVKGQANLIIYSDKIPRRGEVIVIGPETYPGQEEELSFKVSEIIYNLDGHRLAKEMPIVVVESFGRIDKT